MQAPLQPVKLDWALLLAVSVTLVREAKLARQPVLLPLTQLILLGRSSPGGAISGELHPQRIRADCSAA